MADTFFGLDTSLSNLNDDEGGGGPSEDEYDALNDETFGQDSDILDWEVEHEHLAEQLESSRRHPAQTSQRTRDDHQANLEASLSQLVLDEPDAVQSRTLGSSVWRHDAPFAPTPRFPPVILQRPPGLQAPVPLPFAPQQNVQHNMTQMSQPMNNIMGQNQQMPPNNLMQNQMGQNVNQMGQNINQMGQNMNQMGQNVNQFMQNVNQMNSFQNNQMQQNNMMGMQQNMQMHQMGQNVNQMGQNVNQTGQSFNQMSQNQLGQNVMQTGQNFNQMGPNVNQMNPNVNQMGPNVNQMGPNVNQMGPNVNQMGPNPMMQNGNQFNPGMNFPHMLGQPRMLAPPPGMAMPHPGQNFNQNVGQFNPNFRGPAPPKPEQPLNQQNMMMNQPLMPLKHQATQMNQKPNLQPPQLQSPQNKTPNKILPSSTPNQKMQKSRVYNNSKNQNLTSQNLVQMIQNTHPMLQYNNSFHNASHHPMLNNRNFNNNQFVNNHMFNNQRHNGSFSNNRHSMNGDDGSSDGEDRDEYAGLMTQREKQWLINIQMLQLSSGTPYIHDFYYTMLQLSSGTPYIHDFYYTVFLERQANKEKEGIKEAHKANQQNHPFYSNNENSGNREIRSRERHNSLMSASGEEGTPRTYAPAQFENSLGKLQCGSVTAPRKIIDVEVVQEQTSLRTSRAPSRASTTNPAEIPREMRRTKQLLLDIEALYLILLRLEEMNDPLAISNALILKEREEKQKQAEALAREAREREGLDSEHDDSNVFLRNIESVQRRPRPATQPDSPKSDTLDKRQVVNLAVSAKPPVKNLLDENKDELIEKIFAGLLHTSDKIQQVLTVRKGRLLLSRFVARVAATHNRLRALWARVIRAIPTAARAKGCKDEELAALAPHYRKYIQSSHGWSAILESCSLLSEALDPARTHTALTTALTLSCVCALIEKAATLVNTPEATSNERQWSKFLKTLARALKNTTLTVSRPANPLPEHKLTQHLKQLESRTTIEILQRGRSHTEFADVTKTDVMEQLIKHLC
ncbi:hypothetical protein NE865_07522 [Phthorimaea operculella]|nr:hypothetical protein NE865_07522 [Phthorimaea operculella]